jgi:hypothetical protein
MEITFMTGVAIMLMLLAFILMGISLYLFLEDHKEQEDD